MLSLNDIVEVNVSVGSTAKVRSNFNLGLIIGNSEIIDTDTRVKIYEKLDDMTADKWSKDSIEYKAAQVYFSQKPKPNRVAIGRWDSENESAVEAVIACRTADTEWYACAICGAQKEDIIAVAEYIDSADPESAFFYTTGDSDALAGTEGNVLKTLKEKSTHRSLGQYSTQEYAAVAIMGYAMGANKQTANSAYTLAYKKEAGIKTENLTSTQVTILKNQNCNVYINRGAVYDVFEDGVMADGTYFDELLNLDMLKNNIQTAVANALTTENKIAQTDAGMDLLLNYITAPLEKAKKIGFIAPGVWNAAGITVGETTIETGDTLPNGYVILADSVAEQSQEDREKRKSPPIYILAKLSGAIQHVSINVSVNR